MTSLWSFVTASENNKLGNEEVHSSKNVEPLKLLKPLGGARERTANTANAKSPSASRKISIISPTELSSSFFSGVLGAKESSDNVEVAGIEEPAPSLLSSWRSGANKANNNATSGKMQDASSSRESHKPRGHVSFKGPSVYEEAFEMLSASLLIYTFADLRKLARDGKIECKDLMQQPISVKQVMEAIRTHRKVLEERANMDHGELEAQLKALKHILKTQQSSVVRRILRGKKKESVLAHFHDETSTQGMVYGIAVDHIRRRITVIFRGSVTSQDFVTDAKVAQKKVDNPVRPFAPEISKTVNIHTGFYQYLFRKDNDNGKAHFEHIIEHVKALMKHNNGYQLYSTGHSLGGELQKETFLSINMDPSLTFSYILFG
jgi:Lipase (class 3)